MKLKGGLRFLGLLSGYVSAGIPAGQPRTTDASHAVLLLIAALLVAQNGLAESATRPCGLTLKGKTANSVMLTWTAPTNASVAAYEVFRDDAPLGLSTSNSFSCTGLTQDRAYVFRVRARDADGRESDMSNALLATPQSGVDTPQPMLVRNQFHALVLNYDAHIWAEGAYVKASEYYGWRDVSKLIEQYIDLLRRASGGQTVWSVADRYDLDEFAPSATPAQTIFDATNYTALRAQNYSYRVSYDAIIHDPRFGLVEKVNSGKVDAIWVFGMEGIDFWETAMAGPAPYGVNGDPIPDSSLTRNVVFYEFGKAPHQGVGFMCENTSHMTEHILRRISENWPRTVGTRVFQTLNLENPNRVLTDKAVTDWTHFTQASAASWDPELVAPENAQAGLSHFPPTALYNYDWSTMNLDFSGTGPFQVIDGDWSIVDGSYHVATGNSATVLAMDSMTMTDELGSYHPPEAFSDADIELTVRVMNGSYPSYAGVLFRLNSCKPGPNQAKGYYVAINARENRVVLAKLQNQFIGLTNAPYDLRTNFGHRLRVEARGSLIRVFLDGNLAPLITATDETYLTGGFGLSAFFPDAFFDDLRIVPHVTSTADKWYGYPATNNPSRDLTPLEWNGEGAPAMDGFYAWWWEHLPKNGGAHSATDLQNGASALLLNHWWPYIFDINQFTNTRPAPDIVFPPEDVQPPAPPANPATLALGSSKIGLSWTEPYDDIGVTRYAVYRDGVLLGKTPLNHLIDTRLLPNTRYTYEIRACDGSGNLSAGASVTGTTLAADVAGQVLDGGFEFLPEISGWSTDAFSASAAQFNWEPAGSGRNGDRCVSIEASALNDASWVQTVTGLVPGETYWLTGWIRGLEVVRQEGRNTGANICLEGTWTHAPDFLDGTFDWRQASFSFVAPASGTVTVGCRLGYWSNTSRGKVWFDDLAIVQPTGLRFDRVERLNDKWLRLVLVTPPLHRYRVETSADLRAWTELQTFDAAHPLCEVPAPVAQETLRFYRAVRVN